MSFFGDTLGTSEIDVNGINLVFEHFSSPDHCVWIIATKLCDKRSVLRTGGKMLLFISFGGGHDFGMQHGSITEIGAIVSAEESERKLRLIDHGCADEERLFGQESQFIVQHYSNKISFIHWFKINSHLSSNYFKLIKSDSQSIKSIKIIELYQKVGCKTTKLELLECEKL